MVQASLAPPLIPEATNRKTVGTVVVVPVDVAVVVVQVTVPGIGPRRGRRPPVTVVSKVVEVSIVVP
jgi:hypothetical protein